MKNGENDQKEILSHLSSPVSLVIDWIAENIYWTDNVTNVIEVCKIDGSHRKIIISEGLSHPSALDISPKEGLLFWTDFHKNISKIERSYLDGSGRKPLYETRNIISCITIDVINGMLYFAPTNSDENSVSRLEYNAPLQAEPEVVFRKDYNILMSPTSMKYYEGQIWWFDPTSLGGSICYSDVETPSYKVVQQNVGSQAVLMIIGPSLQLPDETNGCSPSVSPCEELCFYKGRNSLQFIILEFIFCNCSL